MQEENIKKELVQVEKYIFKDIELGKLPNDFIGLINDEDLNRVDIIRGVLRHVLGMSGYK